MPKNRREQAPPHPADDRRQPPGPLAVHDEHGQQDRWQDHRDRQVVAEQPERRVGAQGIVGERVVDAQQGADDAHGEHDGDRGQDQRDTWPGTAR